MDDTRNTMVEAEQKRAVGTKKGVAFPMMAHLVLGYPSLAESLRTAETYIAAGVKILELQIPFSHPTADGPVITLACQQATAQGVTVQDCMDAIANLRKKYPDQEIMVMSYLNRLFAYGFQRFLGDLEHLQIHHLIVPDLPVDTQHALFDTPGHKLKLVPVLAANTADERMNKLLGMGFDFFYLMSDFKITGSGFSLHPRLTEIIAKVRTHLPGSRVGIGFGISTPEHVRAVSAVADVAIVGSALIQAQKEGRLEEYLESLRQVFLHHDKI